MNAVYKEAVKPGSVAEASATLLYWYFIVVLPAQHRKHKVRSPRLRCFEETITRSSPE